MKFSICILSVMAAVASAASTQQATFNLPDTDVYFRKTSDKSPYFSALGTYNKLILPEEFPATALPYAIVRPRKANNRALGQVVKTARQHGLRVSARSGGYQSGYSANMAAIDHKKEDFVLIDLSKLNKVTVDPKKRIATAEPGATGLELYTETIKYGLTFPGPHTARVTLGGFTLGGGMGIGSRYYGAASDNLLGVDIVLSDGRTVHASEKSHRDLFFAVRGGGQFFGVVSKLYLKLHNIVSKPTLVPTFNETSVPIDQVFAIFDRPEANALLKFYGDYDHKAPKPLENKIVFVVDPKSNAKQYLFASVSAAPFNSSVPVQKSQAKITEWYKTLPTNFATSDPSNFAGVIHGSDASWADNDLAYAAEDVWFSVPLNPRLQKVLIQQWDKVPSALSSMALNTGPWDAPVKSALGYDRSYSLCIYSTWKRNGDAAWDAKNKAWLDETLKAIKPYTLGYYVNELRPKKLQDRNYWRKCYEKKTYKTLRTTKNHWDPENIFKSL